MSSSVQIVNNFSPFKMVLLGNTGCGKTSLLNHWIQHARGTQNPHVFHDAPTIGVEFGLAYVSDNDDTENRMWKFNIWDTGGQERFRCITRNYYRGCHIVILVYDITDFGTYAAIPTWLDEIRRHYTEDTMPLQVLIGNKTDCNDVRMVCPIMATKYAKDHNLMFFETSTRSGTSVIYAWREITKRIITDMGGTIYISPTLSLSSEYDEQQRYVSRKKCCII